MPPCATCCTACESLLHGGRRSIWKDWSRLAASSNASRRGFKTSTTIRSSISKATHDFPSPRHEALTLLHKTNKLLPSILDSSRIFASSNSKDVWDGLLSQAHEDLSTAEERPVKV